MNESQKYFLLSGLFYNYSSFPNHDFILNYNSNIKVNSSLENLLVVDSIYIKSAWVSLNAISPSVLENNNLYVTSNSLVLSDYYYKVIVPQDYQANNYQENSNGYCKITYELIENNSKLSILVNNQVQGSNKVQAISVNQDSLITTKLEVSVNIKKDNSVWNKYCTNRNRRGQCTSYNYKCEYKNKEYLKDNIELNDSINVKYYDNKPSASIKAVENNFNTIKLNYEAKDYSSLIIKFDNSYYKEQKYIYSVEFTKKPFYIAVLKADKVNIKKTDNLIAGTDNSLYVKNINNCKLILFNHFYNLNHDCNLNINLENNTVSNYQVREFNYDLTWILKLIALLFILYLVYRIIKHFVVRSLN
ncbi:MAG TPA: hypothetical protein VJG30_03955 [Candidatus Nanoarchaeia archaeon]|nr:hypothetical protein [Candidatus Nanoarchaeia archaeon]